ncbi:MAG: hypothetical protein M3461_08600 [Pseudomonadota bacterium]|nr:hypothetical protein [Pseudomonadota bacterium]
MPDTSQIEAITPSTAPSATTHERHCFVVMQFGRDPAEQKWFRGWYEVVIKPAVVEAGFEPKLAATEEQPGAINDEIRSHLALDPMVVVDLGGAEPEDDPNPNVMYELGIRHALGLPLVMLAWKGQRLPFDVGNQRIIMEERDLMDLEQNRKRLVTFIHAAQQGRYYRPMEAVGRIATIQAASESLGEDSLLRALAQEVRDLRSSVVQAAIYRETRSRRDTSPTVKKLIRGKVFRKELYPHFIDLGGESITWGRLLNSRIPPDQLEQMEGWGSEEWKQYISARWEDLKSGSASDWKGAPVGLDNELLVVVRDLLPAQPWPSGVHKDVV